MGAVFCRKSYGDLGKKQAPIISTATPASNSSCNGPSVAKSCQCDPMWKMPLDLSLRSCELRLCEKERSSEALHSAFHGFSFAFLFGFANGAAQGCQPLPAPGNLRWFCCYHTLDPSIQIPDNRTLLIPPPFFVLNAGSFTHLPNISSFILA